MSDFDYGREKGFWGNDGIPYWIDNERPDYRQTTAKPSGDSYTISEKKAQKCGFKAVDDENAYNGRYFIKDGKKWIHNLAALKKTLGIFSEYELKKLGYDVDAYHRYH